MGAGAQTNAESRAHGPQGEHPPAYVLRLEQSYQRAVLARADAEEEDDLVDAARDRLAAIDRLLGDVGHDPMDALARRFELQPAQVDFLWTAVACSVDGRMVPHLEVLGGTPARRGLSPALYATLTAARDAVVAGLAHWLVSPNPLVDNALLTSSENASHAARTYLASPRLIGFLSGRSGGSAPVRGVRADRARLLHDDVQRERIADLMAILHGDPRAVAVIEGPRGSGRVTATACAAGAEVLVLDAAKLGPADLSGALTALRRETALGDQLPVLANADYALSEERPELRRVIGSFIDGVSGPLVVTVTVPGTDLATERPLVRVPWDVASTEVRAAHWASAARAAGVAVAADLSGLAHRYRVGPAAIERAIVSARMTAQGASLDDAALAAGLRHNIAERLGGLARRVEVNQTWDDLVLGEDTVDQINALIGRIRHAHQVLDRWGYRRKIARGAGTAALLSGPPGTGKTMVAGLIARELDLELYQVDLSKVVSKWVGETEKNLARIFDAAEEGHALLLFDEADALFGQRTTEAKGAVDRYANLEVNYLLQRVEAFGGITVLTTNLETAIDAALKRRLAAHIVFATPDEDERTALWQRHTTTDAAPLASDVDHESLARAFPNMTGANIRNAAISAAFLAAGDADATITQDHLLRAGRAEYRSMGHMVSESIGRRSGRS